MLATTSCKIVEALCIKLLFFQIQCITKEELLQVQDISPSPPFVVVPASFEYMYFIESLPLSIDNRGGGKNHVKSVLTTIFGLNSYSVSSFLSVVVTT